jgi:DNA-binding transcriptional regulator YdaS (Cro superfamily)
MDAGTTPFEALQASVEKVGSQSAFARLCRVSQTAVWKWLQSGKRLPAEHVLVVEAKTGVSRHFLRPDIYPRAESPAAPAVANEAISGRMPVVAFQRSSGMKRAGA